MGIPNYGVDFENQYEFVNAGSITVAQAMLAATEKSSTFVDALAATKTIVYNPPRGTPAFELRLRSDGSEGDEVFHWIYAARKEGDDYIVVGALQSSQGTQIATPGGFYHSYMFECVDRWNSGVSAQTSIVNTGFGRAFINTNGCTKFVFIAETLEPPTCYMDIARRDYRY